MVDTPQRPASKIGNTFDCKPSKINSTIIIYVDATNPPNSTKNRIIDLSKIGNTLLIYNSLITCFLITDRNAMRTFKELLQEENISTNINLLVTGRTGQGKSALINSLIELGREIASEGSDTDCCTTTSRSYTYPNIIPGVNVTIIDTPGLQDAQSNEHKYIQEMKNECHEISLVLYCMKMTDQRLTNDDKVAMQKLHQAFGQKFWERVVFVLTLANMEMLWKWDKIRDKDDKSKEPLNDKTDAWEKLKKERLTGRVQHRKDKLNEFVTEVLQLHKSAQSKDGAHKAKFEVLPAGYYCHDPKHDDNLCSINWQCDLIAFCCKTIKHKHKLSKLKLNKSRKNIIFNCILLFL